MTARGRRTPAGRQDSAGRQTSACAGATAASARRWLPPPSASCAPRMPSEPAARSAPTGAPWRRSRSASAIISLEAMDQAAETAGRRLRDVVVRLVGHLAVRLVTLGSDRHEKDVHWLGLRYRGFAGSGFAGSCEHGLQRVHGLRRTSRDVADVATSRTYRDHRTRVTSRVVLSRANAGLDAAGAGAARVHAGPAVDHARSAHVRRHGRRVGRDPRHRPPRGAARSARRSDQPGRAADGHGVAPGIYDAQAIREQPAGSPTSAGPSGWS